MSTKKAVRGAVVFLFSSLCLLLFASGCSRDANSDTSRAQAAKVAQKRGPGGPAAKGAQKGRRVPRRQQINRLRRQLDRAERDFMRFAEASRKSNKQIDGVLNALDAEGQKVSAVIDSKLAAKSADNRKRLERRNELRRQRDELNAKIAAAPGKPEKDALRAKREPINKELGTIREQLKPEVQALSKDLDVAKVRKEAGAVRANLLKQLDQKVAASGKKGASLVAKRNQLRKQLRQVERRNRGQKRGPAKQNKG